MGSLHARVISQSDRTELAWVADRSESAGTAAAARFGTTWVQAMDLTDVDAVVVASSTETHPALALEVLAAGKPLLVEKPLADTLADATKIVEAAAADDIPLMCGFLERFNPAVRTALEIVEHPISAAAVRHSPYVPRIKTGVASDLLIHDIDATLSVFGASAPRDVRGLFGYVHPLSLEDSEDIAEGVLEFEGGALATCSASRVGQRKIRTLSIVEQEREIAIDLLRQDITIYRHVDHAATDDSTGLGYRQQTVIEIPMIRFQGEPLVGQLNAFVDLIEGGTDLAQVRDELLAPHVVLDAVRASAAAKR